MNQTYRVKDTNGRWSPPVSEKQVWDMIRQGIIRPHTILEDDLKRSFAAGDHPALAAIFRSVGIDPAFRPAPPPPPPPPPPRSSYASPIPPSRAPALSPRDQVVLQELGRQRHSLIWWLLGGTFSLLGAIGLPMIIYALIQAPALRRRVAEMGVDPQAWEQEQLRRFWSRENRALIALCWLVGVCVGAPILAVLGFLMWIGISDRLNPPSARNQGESNMDFTASPSVSYTSYSRSAGGYRSVPYGQGNMTFRNPHDDGHTKVPIVPPTPLPAIPVTPRYAADAAHAVYRETTNRQRGFTYLVPPQSVQRRQRTVTRSGEPVTFGANGFIRSSPASGFGGRSRERVPYYRPVQTRHR